MSYQLIIGDRTFSSWSLRGWLMLERFGLPYSVRQVGLYSGTMQEELAAFAPARLVPLMVTPEGHVIGDTMAMAESLVERHPEVALYPADPAARALARWMVAEMHSGFAALRGECPMMLAHGVEGFVPSEAVRADLARVEALWTLARERHGTGGPWLFGSYSLADVFYAPVATRIATFGLPVGAEAAGYVETTLADPAFRRWRARGLVDRYDPFPYSWDLPSRPWPGPTPLPARAVEGGEPVNAACPFSGKAVSHLMEAGGKIIGFCNATCRDKAVNDPLAFPEVAELLRD